tara:strand:- start:9220 stop:10077 length:858 start_codon:yes stop_codon:yes gene_type:complete
MSSYNPGNVNVRTAAGQTTEIQFNSGGFIVGTNKFVLQDVGNEIRIGIGTNTPAENLTVIDHISCTGNVFTSGGQLATGVGSSKFTEPGGDITHLTDANNSVGIGTSAPATKLTVAGPISAQGRSIFEGGLSANNTIIYTSLSASVSASTGIVNGVNLPHQMYWTGQARSNDVVEVSFHVPTTAGTPVFVGEYYAVYQIQGLYTGQFSIRGGSVGVGELGISKYEYINAQTAKAGLWDVSYNSVAQKITIAKSAGTLSPASQSGRWYVRVTGGAGFPTDDIYIVG